MAQFKPLNPELYNALMAATGNDVKVAKAGIPLVLGVESTGGRLKSKLISMGETYKIRCPICCGHKHKLDISYAFGEVDEKTGDKLLIAKCWTHPGSVTQLVNRIIKHFRPAGLIKDTPKVVLARCMGDIPLDPFVSPGDCVRLDEDDPNLMVARDYLLSRGIDPDEAAKTYGVSFCFRGNDDKQAYHGLMQGRIIIPVVLKNELVGWQGRLPYEPPKDSISFADLRYLSMPGSWRSRYVVGYDQAVNYPYVIVVEGPLDMLKQGPPCVATMGQSMSFHQYKLITDTWNKPEHVIILVGDSGEKAAIECNSRTLASMTSATVIAPNLPHDDPGDWDRKDFYKFIADELASGRGIVRGKEKGFFTKF